MELGNKAKDVITGFEGIVTAKASYLTGCDQYLLQPELKEGNFIEPRWFDEGRLEDLGGFITPEMVLAEKNGADMPAPIK